MPAEPSESIRAAAVAWIVRRDAGLTPAEEAELQAWIEADAANGAALARYGSAWAAMDRPRHSGVGQRVLAAVEVHTARRLSVRRTTAAIATLTILLAGGIFWREKIFPGPAFPAGQATVVTPRREKLPDGSTVEFRDDSQIAVAFSPGMRRVSLLNGEAHFEVVKDADRPFVVSAGVVDVRAVGTAFAVQLATDQIQVVVTEGRVAINRPQETTTASIPAAPNYVDAGKRLVVEMNPASQPQPAVPITPAEISAILAWREARLEFSGTSLVDAVAMLNERNSIRLKVTDGRIGQIRVSGVFRANNVEDFVQILETSFGIKAEHRSAAEIVLVKAR